MIKANYHIHSDYCDGKQSLEEMVVAGIDAGLTSMGLSGHMPLPFPNDWTMRESALSDYLETVETLKNKYASRVQIYCGLEIDYFIDRQDIASLAKSVMPHLDYTILSIHTLGDTFASEVFYIDESRENFQQGIDEYYHGDVKAFIRAYYQGVSEMVTRFKPDILGHMDIIKKYNQDHCFFDEEAMWYREIVKTCLDKIAQTKTLVEINTGANLRVPGVGRYPSDWMIPEMKKRNIPITIGGDSHSTEGITFGFEEAASYLQQCGYQHYFVLDRGEWKKQPLRGKNG